MSARVLNFMVHIENVIGIYRNFSVCGNNRKCLIIIRIFVDVTLILMNIAVWMQYYRDSVNHSLYLYLTGVNSTVILLSAVFHSKGFNELKGHMNFGKTYYDGDTKLYQNRILKKQTLFVSLPFIVGAAKICIFVYNQIYLEVVPRIPLYWHYLIELNILMCDLRYMFEYLMLYLVLAVMSEQIQFMTHFIDSDRAKGDNIQTIDYMSYIKDRLTVPKIHRWYKAYEHIRESCRLFNHIFGLQLTIMLSTAMFFYINVLYKAASQGVAGALTVLDITVFCGTLMLLLSILFMLSRSAQCMQNSADILRRRVCKALIYSVSNAESYKTIRDMLRTISTRPIRPRAFGSINVDMTLIPTCISFFTTYTVIALQFNNVL